MHLYTAWMVLSPELHFANVEKEPTSASIQINEACRLYPWRNIFQDEYIGN